MSNPSPIPTGYIDNVCKKGQGSATCAFLGFSQDGFMCLKKSPFDAQIQNRLREGSMNAKGDNYSGPTSFEKAVAV